MTGTDLCVNKCKQSRSYLNHLVLPIFFPPETHNSTYPGNLNPLYSVILVRRGKAYRVRRSSQALSRGLQLPAGHLQLLAFSHMPYAEVWSCSDNTQLSTFRCYILRDPEIPLSTMFSNSLSRNVRQFRWSWEKDCDLPRASHSISNSVTNTRSWFCWLTNCWRTANHFVLLEAKQKARSNIKPH